MHPHFTSAFGPRDARSDPIAAMYGNQEAMDGFAQVMSGVVSPAEFFSEQNVGRIVTMAQ